MGMVTEQPSGQAVRVENDNESSANSKVAGMVAPVETLGVGLDTLGAILATKDSELRMLQKTHDEYVRSSCEYEKELEGEIERYEKKTHTMDAQIQSLEESKAQLQSTLTQLQNELAIAAKREQALAAQAEEMKWRIQRLEQTNDELETATRVAQASIEELQHRVDTLTEENVFLQQEKEDVAASVEPTPDPDVVNTTTSESLNSRAPERRKTGRYPEVVESCLHMTCTNDQCRHAQIAVMLPTDQAMATKSRCNKKASGKRPFFERIRRLCARS